MSSVITRVADVAPMTIQAHGPMHQIRKLFETRELGIFHSTMLPNCTLPNEVHAFDEVLLRLEGRSTTRVDGEDNEAGAGVVLVMAAGTWHQTTSLETARDVEQIALVAYHQSPGSILDEVLNSFQPCIASEAAQRR